MCLSFITKQVKNPTKTVKKGWKWLRIEHDLVLVNDHWVDKPTGYLIYPFNPIRLRRSELYTSRVVTGRWIRAGDPKHPKFITSGLVSHPGPKYEAGFHIFLTKKAAKEWLEHVYLNDPSWILVPVEYKEVTTYGRQYNLDDNRFGRCVVARWMKVLYKKRR